MTLSDLKTGDTVIYDDNSRGFGPNHESRFVLPIIRETPTRLILQPNSGGKEIAFDKESGYQVGFKRNGFGSITPRISIATPELIQQIRDNRRAQSLAYKIGTVKWDKIPLAVLEAVEAALQMKGMS